MIIRSANKNDIQNLLYLINQKANFDRSLGDFNGIVSNSEKKILNTMFTHQPYAWAYLAENEYKIPVGMAFYHFRYSSFKGLPSIWLDDLFILHEYRGLGLGKKLFLELEKLAKNINASHIGWVASDLNSKGKLFYSRIGSEIIKSDGSTLFYEYIINKNE
jgi:GNAT superfamily N-acetyltransferase